MLSTLDLFSGIGGFTLGFDRAGGFRTVAFCEADRECQGVLRARWPNVPIHGDVRSLTAADLPRIDAITGGFPCQDLSTAGQRRGLAAPRSGLWRDYARLIGECRPRWVLIENVAGLLSLGIEQVLGDLAALGYDAEWHAIPAAYVGTPHIRDRIWILAHSHRYHRDRPVALDLAQSLAQCQVRQPRETAVHDPVALGRRLLDPTDSGHRRADDGLSEGMDRHLARVRMCGNAIVPQIAEAFAKAIQRYEREQE